jgi:hypothetical protein
MRTPQWIRKLGGHAGELYVAAELSKRGIPNALLPENFSDDDLIIGRKGGSEVGYVQVKSCHPDRANTFELYEKHASWEGALDNQYVVFVWLGSVKRGESPVYWIAKKSEVGRACAELTKHVQNPNRERKELRFAPDLASGLNPKWKYKGRLEERWRNDWGLFDRYRPPA